MSLAITHPDGRVEVLYTPTPKQAEFHARAEPNVLYVGARGTGKSLALRMEAHTRALATPNFSYAIVRGTYPDLVKTHLNFIEGEMRKLGGTYHKTDRIAYYPNGSKGFYSHCNDGSDVGNLLSAEFYWLGLDELSTIPWDTFRKISASVRVPKNSGLTAMVRGATNPIGGSAGQLRSYFVTKDVDPYDDPDYIPGDWHAVQTVLTDNPHLDIAQYRKQFSGLGAHYRKAWLDGEWVTEGAYFEDFCPSQRNAEGEEIDWHCVREFPRLDGAASEPPPFIYRTIDWGWHPDPAVCLWIAVYPSGRAIVLKERTWNRTTAADVAQEIYRTSQGMRLIDTLCDPTMFANAEATGHSIGNIFEMNRVPLTPSKNDRTAAGMNIHEWLGTVLPDGKPKLQIYAPGCPMLVRTLPEMQIDRNNPAKIADGNDHWVISLAYFCMSAVATPRVVVTRTIDPWRRRLELEGKKVLGRESVRKR